MRSAEREFREIREFKEFKEVLRLIGLMGVIGVIGTIRRGYHSPIFPMPLHTSISKINFSLEGLQMWL